MQTYGFTQAFIVAAVMFGVAAVITFVGLNIRHEDLATDGADSAGAEASAAGAAEKGPASVVG